MLELRPLLRVLRPFGVALVGAALAACAGPARLTVAEGSGPQPQLPPPRPSLLPTVNVAPAAGWAADEHPTGPPGTVVTRFATGLDHPRWLLVLPDGDVLVAESNAPARPDDGVGIKAWFQRLFMRRAGAGVPSADRLTLLRDADGDGQAETRSVYLSGLHSPFGMAVVKDTLYVANTDGVVRVPYRAGALQAIAVPVPVTDLPGGPVNHHWTKNLIASRDGARLYMTVGSNSNVGERGEAAETGRAAIWELDLASGTKRIFASGLRNPNGMAWEPHTGRLWTVVNERDELGSDLVPDYLTAVRDGAFYGWPYSYFGAHVDARVRPPRPDRVAQAVVPDYALGPHTASLGLAHAEAADLGTVQGAGMFVGQHGSWNRSPLSGYRVVFVPFVDGRPTGLPVDVLTGFIDDRGRARGRPVGVALDGRGGLLVADDVGNVVWRVSKAR